MFNFRWGCPLLWGLQLLPNARDSWQVTARDSIDIQPEEIRSKISSLEIVDFTRTKCQKEMHW